jgi:hypothetical protein
MTLLDQLTDYLNYPKSLERLGICSQCDQLEKETLKCKQCGCHMKVKALIPLASCPLNKWSAETSKR